MSNLPINWEDKIDSPELVAWLQQFGLGRYINAAQINKLRDAINELHARTADTRIIENTGIEIVGTNVVINESWKWLIVSILYSNDSQITLPITLATEGNQKICYLCANQDNGFELVYGPESETNPSAPTIVNNLLPVTFFLVTDGSVGTPAEPIVGDVYKKKSENLGYSYLLKGTRAVIQLRPEGHNYYSIGSSLLISVDGFGLSLITGNPNAEMPYPMKDLFIHNTGTTPFTLLHDGTGSATSKFFFLDETDLVVPPGGKVWLKYGGTYCQLFLTSWTEQFIPTFQQVTDQGNVTNQEITAAGFRISNGQELPTKEWVYDKFASKENLRQYNYAFLVPIDSIRLELPPTESYLIIDSLINSIKGFNVSFSDLFDGKDYFIYNNSSDEITLKNNSDNAICDFNFKAGVNIKLPRRGVIHLKFIGGKFIDVNKSWIDSNELQPYLDTKQDKAFNIKVTTPSSIVTGSVSEVEVLKVTIPPNSLSLNEIINMPLLILTKTGTAGTCEIRVKISTASTMPSGNTDAIARYSSGSSNLFAKMQRDFIIDNGTIKVYPLSSNVIDNTTSASVILTKSFDPTVTNYLYVSLQQSATGDSSVLQGFYLTNQ